MKRKFILLTMLFALLGGVNLNVLNAQEENCNVIFTLKDSSNDGWYGGYLTVSYGTTSENVYCQSGNVATTILQIPTGSAVTVKYTVSSSYPTYEVKENSFTIAYESGEIVVSAPEQGQNMVNGATYNFTVDSSPKAPVSPTLEAETTSGSTIALSWNTVGGADKYILYDGNENTIAGNLTTTNYIVENLEANTNYCYTVTAVNDVGESEPSNEACATTFEKGSTLVIIGEGTKTNPYAPIYNYYSSNSISQMIYTSTELGNAGFIKSISFRPSYANNTRNISLYLKNVNRNHFYDESVSRKWEDLSDAECVFSGNLQFSADVWTTIAIPDGFLYEGSNLLVCVIDNTNSSAGNTGNYFYCDVSGTTEISDIRAIYKGNSSPIDYLNLPQSPSALYASGSYLIPQAKFLIAPASASIEVPETISLGDVRMGNFFTEKPLASKDVEVKVTSTTVTSVSCDNDFFTISNVPTTGDALSKTFTFNVGYNKDANVNEPQNGTITIKWADGEDVIITVSATPYTATAPDAIEAEAFTTVAFTDNAFEDTPEYESLHDDYKLPGEEVEEGSTGNTPDAVYQFTLEEDATIITASITGDEINNSYLAIYNAETMGNGPSSNNNDTGVQPAPSAPTTFSFNFDSCIEDGFKFIDANNDGYNWQFSEISTYDYGIASYSYQPTQSGYMNISPDNYVITETQYSITNSSKLSFEIKSMGYSDKYGIVISEDDTYGDSDIVFSEVYTGTSYKTVEIDFSQPTYSSFVGKNVYVGVRHYDSHGSTGYGLVINDLTLTDGSSKSRAAGLAKIEAQYPAGTYYLVAAADKAFTVNLSTASVPAPTDFALIAPEDNATGQDNPTLTWEASQYATEYKVLLGTTNPPTEIAKDWTSNITSFKTEGLANNTRYYWQVIAQNVKGEKPSEIWSFVTTLDVPENVKVTSENHIAGGSISLEWDAIKGASSYNVYVGDILHNEGNPISTTEYTINNIDYSQAGWNITVTAVYDGLGESEKSAAVNVKVTGYGNILVNVNGGIAKVNYTINGTDEFGNAVEEITGVTDEYGMSTVKVLVGTYNVTVSKFDYKDATVENVVVNNNENKEVSINMTQNPAAEFEVTAVDNITTANVSWTTDKYTTFNVYRKDSEGNVEKLASNITAKQYQDAAWNEFESDDEYQYGVSAMMDVTEKPINNSFDTSIDGWTTKNNNDNTETWVWTSDNNGGGFINMYRYESSSFGNKYSVYKMLDLTNAEDAVLNFKYRTYSQWGSSYKNTLSVSVVTDLANIYTATPAWSSNSYTNQDWYESGNVNLDGYIGGSVYVVFTTTMNYCRSYIDDIVVTTTSMTESRVNWAPAITKEEWVAFDGTENNTWSSKNVLVETDHEIEGEVTVNTLTINGAKLTVAKNAKLTVNDKMVNATASNFVIEDGAQVFQSSADVKATFNMGVLKPSEWSTDNKEGWNFIASPFTNAAWTSITFMQDAANIDLYKYNGAKEGAEWRHYSKNQEQGQEFGTGLFDSGEGYLFAQNKEDLQIKLSGSLNYAQTKTWELSYNSDKDLANFHLIGNPFSFDMDWNNVAVENMVNGYAVLNEAGSGYEYMAEGTIAVGDAFFVKTTADNPAISYPKAQESKDRGEKAASINLIATGAEGSDNVIISLSGAENEGFNKLQNFNENIATLFVVKNNKRYGIANFDNNVTMVNVAFETPQMGSYTIAAQPQGKFETLTLVDRFTGIETNLLMEDYSFTATSREDFNRFIVKFEVNNQEPTANNKFVYQNGEELIFGEEGAVQIIDMMGRVVYTSDVTSDNNRINVSAFDNAAYVIRVINENGVKAQKVVIY